MHSRRDRRRRVTARQVAGRQGARLLGLGLALGLGYSPSTDFRFNAAVAASGPAQAGPAEANLTLATRGLLGLVESYPQLKANDNIRQLQEELTGTENKIAFARQFYNDSVAAYNTRRQSFPAVLAAASLGFGPIELFNMPEAEKEVPRVALR